MRWEWRALREARQVWQAADEKLRKHRRDCAGCIKARRTRNPDDACREGRQLLASREAAQRDLKAERLLAKEPIPGQAELALFDP